MLISFNTSNKSVLFTRQPSPGLISGAKPAASLKLMCWMSWPMMLYWSIKSRASIQEIEFSEVGCNVGSKKVRKVSQYLGWCISNGVVVMGMQGSSISVRAVVHVELQQLLEVLDTTVDDVGLDRLGIGGLLMSSTQARSVDGTGSISEWILGRRCRNELGSVEPSEASEFT